MIDVEIQIDHDGNGFIPIEGAYNIQFTPNLWPRTGVVQFDVDDMNGAASQFYTKSTTQMKKVKLLINGTTKFQGVMIDRDRIIAKDRKVLHFIAGGHFFQFSRKNISYSCVSDVHYYTTHEALVDGQEGSEDAAFSGLVNSFSGEVITDNNKSWDTNEWVDGSPNKYGLIIIKNPHRPATSFSVANYDSKSGTVDDTYTNDADYVWAQKAGAAFTMTFIFNTTISRADISAMRVNCTFESISGSAGANGTLQIYNYTDTQWDTIKTISGVQVFVGSYAVLEDGTPLSPADHIKSDGEMQLKYTAPVGYWIHSYSEMKVYYSRIKLTISDMPSLQWEIDSNTATTITATGVDGNVDLLDYYVIGQLSSEVLKKVLTDAGNAIHQAVTVNNVADGSLYLRKIWDYALITHIVDYCLGVESYDAWLDADNDVHTQDSSSASASDLTFDESNERMQVNSYRDVFNGNTLFNRYFVQWQGGIVQSDDATSQATYGVLEAPLVVRRDITSSDEAQALADRLVSGGKNIEGDFAGVFTAYQEMPIGQTMVINAPSRNISNETRLLITATYTFSVSGTEVRFNCVKHGSVARQMNSQEVEIARLKMDLRETQQTMAVTPSALTTISAQSSAIAPHATRHYSDGDDPVFLDQDDMSDDDEQKGASQQSIKAFVEGKISDDAYAAGWNGVTTIAPSKNAVYDKIEVLLGLDKQFDIAKIIDGATSYATRLQFGGASKRFHWHLIGTPNIQSYNMISSNAIFFMNNLYYDAAYARDYATNMGLMLQLYTNVNDTSYFYFIGYTTGDAFTKYLKIFPKIAGITITADGPIQIQPTSTTEFSGTVDLATQSASLVIRRVRQADQPTPAAGEVYIWSDSDDDKVYWIYNDANAGVVKIEMT